MRKLLAGLVAALTVTFGLVGCSTDRLDKVRTMSLDTPDWYASPLPVSDVQTFPNAGVGNEFIINSGNGGRFVLLRVVYSASAVAANRAVEIIMDTDTGRGVLDVNAPAMITAGQAVTLLMGPGMPWGTQILAGQSPVFTMPTPSGLILGANWSIFSNTVGKDAGDQYVGITLVRSSS